MTLPASFWRWVDIQQPAGCWIWTGCKALNGGYGVYGKPLRYAHVMLWDDTFEPLPPGLERDHLCRTPECVNPHHLEAVTHAENMRRGTGASGRNARRTHCVHGHPFDEDNTRIRKDNGSRVCRTCSYLRCRDHRRRLSALLQAS